MSSAYIDIHLRCQRGTLRLKQSGIFLRRLTGEDECLTEFPVCIERSLNGIVKLLTEKLGKERQS